MYFLTTLNFSRYPNCFTITLFTFTFIVTSTTLNCCCDCGSLFKTVVAFCSVWQAFYYIQTYQTKYSRGHASLTSAQCECILPTASCTRLPTHQALGVGCAVSTHSVIGCFNRIFDHGIPFAFPRHFYVAKGGTHVRSYAQIHTLLAINIPVLYRTCHGAIVSEQKYTLDK